MIRLVNISMLVFLFVFGLVGGASATMIYSDNDYSCGLEQYSNPITDTNSLEIATNIAVYAGGGKTTIGFYRLVSNGDWNTDYPTADNNLKNYMAGLGYTLNTGVATLGVTDLANVDVLFFAGHNSFSYTPGEIALLKTYLDNGGLMWIDDCAGSPAVSAFESSFDALVYAMYGEHLSVLPASHLVFSSYYHLSGSDFSFTAAGNGTEWAQLPLQGYENHPGQVGVPEPATMLLLAIGVIGVAGARRKFKI